MDVIQLVGLIAGIITVLGVIYTFIRNLHQDQAKMSNGIATIAESVRNLEAGQQKLEAGQQRLDQKIDDKVDKLDKKIDKIAETLDGKIDKVAGTLDGKIGKVTNDLANFKAQAFATFVQKSELAQLTANNSPINLTDEGEEVAQQSKIDQFIAKRKQSYFKELDQAIGDAEVFEVCIQIALRELGERTDEIRFIKDYFYNAGFPAQTDQIFALKLRNIYQQHKVKQA